MTTVRRTGARTWEADSRTHGGPSHRIDLALDGTLLCRCAAAAFNRECWAVREVRKDLEMTAETGLTVAPLHLQSPVSLIPSDSELNRMGKIAAIILAGGVDLPKELNTPEKVMAVMLKGRALGLDPTIAIEHIHYIDGHAVPDAQIMAGILARDIPDSRLMLMDEVPEHSCTMRLILPSRGVDASYTVSMDDADVRILTARDTPHQARGRDNSTYTTKPGGWVAFPRDRLRWHATKRLLKIYAPDVINGLAMYGVGEYSEPGEAEMIRVEGQVVNRATGEIAAPAAPPVHEGAGEVGEDEDPRRGPPMSPPAPGPQPVQVDQLGRFADAVGAMDSKVFMAELINMGATTDELARVAPPKNGGTKADIGGWLRANPTLTLEDLLTALREEMSKEDDDHEQAELGSY